MVSNKNRIQNSRLKVFSHIKAKQLSSKVLFVGKKTRRPLGHFRAKIEIVGSSK